MGVVIGKKEFMDAAQETFISSTYWTESIGPTATIATIKKMQFYKVQEHMVSCGKYVQEGWKSLAAKYGLDVHVGGMYPMSHIDFKKQTLILKTLFTQEMLKKGFLATTAYYSSYAHKQEHLDIYLQAIDEVFAFIAKVLKDGKPQNYLEGPICQSGFKRLS
jgi:glutamate-1-semialdehyde aminotransferase